MTNVTGSTSVPVRGNGKTMVLWDGNSQYGPLRQGGDAVNPCKNAGATSQTMPVSNSRSSQFTGNVLMGLTNSAENSGIVADISNSLTKTTLTMNLWKRTQ